MCKKKELIRSFELTKKRKMKTKKRKEIKH